MPGNTPEGTIEILLDARRKGDMAIAISCYELTATVVVGPGESRSGAGAISEFVKAASSLPLAFHSHAFVVAGDIATHTSDYSFETPATGLVKGRTMDVLRRGQDGYWKLVIDNPWAAQ